MHLPPPTSSLTTLLTAPLARPTLPPWPQFHRPTRLTHLGRTAIALYLSLIHLRPADEVLVPAYHCGSELDPILHAGLTPVLYRTDAQGNIDLYDLLARITPKTKLIYIIHYFGFPQNLQSLAPIAREKNIPLLEDCALSLFSSDNSTPLGTTGNAAIFSFPKSLGTPDGGALTLSQPAPFPPLAPAPSIRRRTLSLIKRRLQTLLLSGTTPPAPDTNNPEQDPLHPDMPADYYFDPALANRAISPLTQKLLTKINPAAIIAARRKNFETLHALLGSHGLSPLYSALPATVCPLAYPLIVNKRRATLNHLWQAHISAYPWWEGYHRNLDFSPFPEARHLKDHLITLPIHQDLNESHMHYIAKTLLALPQDWTQSRTRSVSEAHLPLA